MNALRRVAITGIGVFTPIGHGVDGLWRGLCRGKSAVRRVSRFDARGYRSQLAAEIDDFDPRDYLDARASRRMDRFAQLGVAAATQALADSDLSAGEIEPGTAG